MKHALHDVDDAAVCVGRVVCDGEDNADVDVAAAVAAAVAAVVGAGVTDGVKDADAELVALATVERPTPLQANRLCVLLLDALRRGRLDAGVAHAAEARLLAPDVPVSRRLQWATLRALAEKTGDAIGLTRAKEAVLGALNGRGLTETFDLARFERQRLALGEGAGQRVAARGEQLAVLSRLLPVLVPQPLEMSERREALLKAIVLHGLARLGADVADLATAVELEAPAHDEPVRLLLRLYVARAVQGAREGPDAAARWAAEVQRTLETAERIEDRRVAEWLVKRSAWLRAGPPVEPPLVVRSAVEKLVRAAVDDDRADIAGAIHAVAAIKGCYDFEIASAVERLLEHALTTGRDDAIVATAAAARGTVPSLRIASYRARVLGAVVRAAATVSNAALVSACLEDVAELAGDRSLPATRELLMAVRPALFALRRLGALDAARTFLAAFIPITQQTLRETAPLAAALAEGALLLGDHDEANALLERAIARTRAPSIAHVDRYEAGLAVVRAVVHWPLAARITVCESFLTELRRFDDTFTTRAYFPTHQLLLAEAIVDCLADEVTMRSDRVQAHLDEDEVRVRRRILRDWNRFQPLARSASG